MKQFVFTSNLAQRIEQYLSMRVDEGYILGCHGYYLQELDSLSKSMKDKPFVTKELIDAWDALKPYL